MRRNCIFWTLILRPINDAIGTKVFVSTKDDNKPGQSIEDKRFVSIMDTEMVKNAHGFRDDTRKRFNSTTRTLDRKPEMKKRYSEFMHKLFEDGHVKSVRQNDQKYKRYKGPRWCLPHPRKPGKIRVVRFRSRNRWSVPQQTSPLRPRLDEKSLGNSSTVPF